MLNDISQTEIKPFSIGNTMKWPGNHSAKIIHAFFFLLFSCQVMSDSLGPHELQHTRFPSLFTISIESVMLSNHLIPCHPIFLLPSVFPSIRVFSNGLALHIRWPMWRWRFSFSPSNEYAGLISFRIDWFAFLAVQGTLKSLIQHCSLKASILWHSTFFMVQLSHLIWLLEKP